MFNQIKCKIQENFDFSIISINIHLIVFAFNVRKYTIPMQQCIQLTEVQYFSNYYDSNVPQAQFKIIFSLYITRINTVVCNMFPAEVCSMCTILQTLWLSVIFGILFMI